MKMLLPLIAGLLLVLTGQENAVLGSLAHPISAEEVAKYDKLLNKLFLIERLQQEEKRKQDTLAFQEEVPKGFAEKEVNLAAGDQHEDAVDPITTPKASSSTTSAVGHAPNDPQPQVQPQGHGHDLGIPKNDFLFAAIISACCIAGFVGLVMAGVCWYKLHSRVKAASDVEYPAYGVTGPTKERLPSPGDRKLAQSAQMYHYQHQKQQMIAMEKANGDMKPDQSDEESEEENEEGDYTVYECPGLAPTGEMEVRNPLFNEEAQTPKNGGPGSMVNGVRDGGDDDAQ